MNQAIFFDLFGTLLNLSNDSKPYHQIINLLPEHERDSAFHRALTEDFPTLQLFAQSLGLDRTVVTTKMLDALQYDLDTVTVFPDALPTLAELRGRGHKLTLVSNLATPYKTPFYCTGLAKYFDQVIFSFAVGLKKPDAEIYQLALDRTGATVENTMMVGDSLQCDVLGPQTIGIKSLHLKRAATMMSSHKTITTLSALTQLTKLPRNSEFGT